MSVFTIFADPRADFGRRSYPIGGDLRKVFPVGFDFHPVANSARLDDGTWVGKEPAYQGVPVDPTWLPKKIQIGGGKSAPVDAMFHNRFFVSGRFRDVIERLEPGLHQFVPVELVWKDGSHAASYSWLYPCNRIDCMDRDHTTHELNEKAGVWVDKPGGSYVVALERVDGRHIWIDPRMAGFRLPFVSGDLRQAMTEADVRGIGYNTIKTV